VERESALWLVKVEMEVEEVVVVWRWVVVVRDESGVHWGGVKT
jgi:hypothetical protein